MIEWWFLLYVGCDGPKGWGSIRPWVVSAWIWVVGRYLWPITTVGRHRCWGRLGALDTSPGMDTVPKHHTRLLSHVFNRNRRRWGRSPHIKKLAGRIAYCIDRGVGDPPAPSKIVAF